MTEAKIDSSLNGADRYEFNHEAKLAIAEEFIRRLISPEVYGLQLSDEVRVEAVRALKLISTTYK